MQFYGEFWSMIPRNTKTSFNTRIGEIFFSASSESEKNFPDFKIYVTSTEPEKRRQRLEHHHTECEISMIVSGECYWNIGDKIYHGNEGDIFLISSNENHYLPEILGDDPLLLLNILFETRFIWSPGEDRFNLRYLSIFLDHDDSFSNVIPKDHPVAKTIYTLMDEIYNECLSQEAEYQLVVKAKLMLILAALGRYYGIASLPSVPVKYRQHLKQLDQALTFINKNLTGTLSLEQIAKEACMSKSYFSTMFRKMNGISVWDYITRKRVGLSMQYLKDSDLSVLAVAEKCGFSSISNFNRSFREITGTSPSTYRKEYAEGPADNYSH